MKSTVPILILFLILATLSGKGQHHPANTTSQELLQFSPVLTQLLSDPELAGYKLESSVMTIAPGAVDTIAHRHDCELFGYVMEGEVIIGLDRNRPSSFTEGNMFYEKRNVLHSLTRNANTQKPAKVLLLFIIKTGRKGYIKEQLE